MQKVSNKWVGAVVSMTVAVAAAIVLSAGCGGGGTTTTDAGGGDATSTCTGTLCGASCVDTKNDNTNCGACGKACGNGEVCSAGVCATSCGGGSTLCGSICADTKVDPANCGGCGKACAGGEVCSASTCGTTCASTQTLCGGDGGAPYCASTQSDNANCGGCGIVCGAGNVCQAGVCTNACASSDGGVETLCAPDAGPPYCASTQTDNANCGGCGITCGGGTSCQGGVCSSSCGTIDGGVETLCTPDAGAPYCANTQGDPSNCGKCGNTCAVLQACVNGQCQSQNVTLAGNFAVSSGVVWTTNPATVTCVQECAVLFGGNATDYACSTSATQVDHQSWVSCWGDGTHCFGGTAVADNYDVNTTYNCGTTDCACSAYVQDHCGATSVNYCWK